MGTRTQTEFWIEIAQKFQVATGNTEFTKRELAAWAFENKLADIDDHDAIRILSDQVGKALRNAEIIAPDGTPIRMYASARLNQKHLWSDIREASYEFVVTSFDQRRRQVEGDAQKVTREARAYNQFYKPSSKPDIVLRFNLEER